MIDVAAARRRTGIDRVVLGIGDGSYPGEPDEDVGRGSPYSRGAARFHAFVAGLGFDGIQLLPQGQTSPGNLSPYDASIFARDFLSIALGPLVEDGLLAQRTLAELVGARPPGDRRVHHRYAWSAQVRALDEAYAGAGRLRAEIEAFRAEDEDWLRRRKVPDFERHLFEQFLIHEQHRELRATLPGLRLYGDLQIGMPPEDVDVLRDLFLPDRRMGAPPSRTNPAGQPWGYPVFDPRRRDEVVTFLHRRIHRMLRSYDGIRVDHPHGLVCPWVYRDDVAAGARLYASPDLPELAPYAIARPDQLDPRLPRHADGWVRELDEEQVDRYAALFDVIVGEVRAAGDEVEDVVCEVLSTLPYPLARTLARHDLGRFRVVQKLSLDDPGDVYRIERAEPHDWIMLGNHDTPPIWQLVRTWGATGELTAQATYLARRLAPQPSAVAALQQEFLRSPERVALAKFADLFVSRARHVVVFFTDLFGFTEDYNVPGTVHADNWSLRLPADFEQLYHERVALGAALNIPAALALALEARGLVADETGARLTTALRALAAALGTVAAVVPAE